jgi:hypothetical protein
VYKFLALIEKKKDKFNVIGFESTRDINILKDQILEYVKSLLFDSEYYDPFWRKGLFEEIVIIDYLDSIGFKSNGISFGIISFSLCDKNIYGFNSSDITITIHGLDSGYDDNIPDEVSICLWISRCSWVEIKSNRNATDIIKAIDTMLSPLYIKDSADNLLRAETFQNVSDLDVMMNKIVENSVVSVNYKDMIRKKLTETLSAIG